MLVLCTLHCCELGLLVVDVGYLDDNLGYVDDDGIATDDEEANRTPLFFN